MLDHAAKKRKDKVKRCIEGSHFSASIDVNNKRKAAPRRKVKTITKGKTMACVCTLCDKWMPYPSNLHAESHGFTGGWREAVTKQVFLLVGLTFEEMKEKFEENSRICSGKVTEKRKEIQQAYRAKKKKECGAC